MRPDETGAAGPAAAGTIVELRQWNVVCRADPSLGGAIVSLTVDGDDLLRPPAGPVDDVLDTACFPLVPFANRIDHGRFAFRGQSVELPADPAARPHAHHGFGWRRPWRVAERNGATATFVLEHEPDAWPWALRATQRLSLVPDGLVVDLSVLNRSDRPMPCGAGLHPFFPRDAASYVETGATSYVTVDASGIPDGRSAFRPGRHGIEDLEPFDNLLLDPSGRIVLGSGGRRVVVTAAGMAGFHVYVPRGAPFFCVEPVSHVPDAFRHAAPGDVLNPGHTREWRIEIACAD